MIVMKLAVITAALAYGFAAELWFAGESMEGETAPVAPKLAD